MKPSKEMSSWLIVLVVLATAFVTSWAMLKYKPSPEINASYYYPPQQVAQNLSPGIAALQGGWQFAAGLTCEPRIPWPRCGQWLLPIRRLLARRRLQGRPLKGSGWEWKCHRSHP